MCSLSYTCIYTRVHTFTHKHTLEEGKRFVYSLINFCSFFNSLPVLLHQTMCPSRSLSVCVSFFLVCCFVKSA